MKDPFKNIEKAFSPFWQEACVATMKSGETQTILCCVFDDVEGDALSDDMIDTSRRDILIMCQDEDWCFIQRLKRGDTIQYNNEKYAVSETKNDPQLGVVIKARQFSS